jgi:hypothetical protein
MTNDRTELNAESSLTGSTGRVCPRRSPARQAGGVRGPLPTLPHSACGNSPAIFSCTPPHAIGGEIVITHRLMTEKPSKCRCSIKRQGDGFKDHAR